MLVSNPDFHRPGRYGIGIVVAQLHTLAMRIPPYRAPPL